MRKTITSRILLIGLPACGKSTVGRKLAEKRNVPFIDLDEKIIALHPRGFRPKQIVLTEGEDSFRKWEKQAWDATRNEALCVIAVGGGTPCNPYINWGGEEGFCIFLSLSPELALKRLSQQGKYTIVSLDFFLPFAAKRAKIYTQLSHLTIAVDQKGPEEIVAEIIQTAFDTP